MQEKTHISAQCLDEVSFSASAFFRKIDERTMVMVLVLFSLNEKSSFQTLKNFLAYKNPDWHGDPMIAGLGRVRIQKSYAFGLGR
ncbi:hypothetical protein F7734_28745 [Scytonema sp. UIC 10036]|uniref:hypothetical protein n=1 Tax=Scytonema sp. UIC 10036 TaxID=2304196 RepID=UPI0012DADFB8|nr:hypothetical protein [Scytonema sp. UIC 10036]MUG96113.1 hypothetical protein [Scytonema sp. UIC 10036]